MVKLKIRKKDKVMVIAGRDRGKTGEVLRVLPEDMRVLVSKVNIVTKHRKHNPNAGGGGLQKMEAAIAYSNVMLVCPKCDKPIRPRLQKLKDGEVVRICRKCGESIV
ncbi:MAG: 50S ribosomal protein L24 [Elusimicrobia bacterium]|nr:50S ribosomal protein L24 [Elusimicrobiota bacterium]